MDGHVLEENGEIPTFIRENAMMNSDSERSTAGFCSASEEDYERLCLHSPSASEDSVEVTVVPISFLRNKRKLVEPRKFQDVSCDKQPLKKRHRFHDTESSSERESSRSSVTSPCPFRPWTDDFEKRESRKHGSSVHLETHQQVQAPPFLLLKKSRLESNLDSVPPSDSTHQEPPSSTLKVTPQQHQQQQEEPLSLVLRGYPTRVPYHPAVCWSSDSVSSSYSGSCSERVVVKKEDELKSMNLSLKQEQLPGQQQQQQRNYKNMTRERRIEANARERTRVHTISAAFETLRKSIPAYSHNQKLSKLSVLRIACSYIMTLGKILEGGEYAKEPVAKKEEEVMEEQELSLEDCVNLVSRTIQTEGKLRRKKDD